MRLLVTGGAGFIGSHFVRTLLGPGHTAQVTVLDALTYAGNLANLAPVLGHPCLDFVHGDIRDRALVDALLRHHDAVVHFAAESHVDRSIDSGTECTSTNVLGTQTLLESAVTAGLRRFVHVSTDEVYGSVAHGSWTETEPPAPNSPYAASKAGSDLLALAYHRTHGLDVRVTRCSNNYGPFQHPEKIIPLFTTRLLQGRTVPLYGDGGNVRDWLHVDDHCRALRLVLDGGRPGEIYNIGGGTELTNTELTARLLDACDASWDSVEHVADRKGHDRRYSVDWTKIRTELGYQPQHTFDAGLAETVDWYRTHRDWWQR
ncbi:dTDP-glucose 4,6-dehydratase [Streptomyces pinistramenti]|uniref:dTDP-glucose 4,6-dehydratase n=1 Tax=Streptomyces pinistramenti TaxID=2884812 RepID=UPI001D06B5AF|nr:dTDP-glucose 4,6-dehydratase [Streptomyces pinistramenti]MCB5909146.1 dTDP-glucose 4,6-dehydratase [Streptomyces pinistramenti]